MNSVFKQKWQAQWNACPDNVQINPAVGDFYVYKIYFSQKWKGLLANYNQNRGMGLQQWKSEQDTDQFVAHGRNTSYMF